MNNDFDIAQVDKNALCEKLKQLILSYEEKYNWKLMVENVIVSRDWKNPNKNSIKDITDISIELRCII